MRAAGQGLGSAALLASGPHGDGVPTHKIELLGRETVVSECQVQRALWLIFLVIFIALW